MRTLPSVASNNLTGQSLIEATKQNTGGLCFDAPGYHAKSTIGAEYWNVLEWIRDVDPEEAMMTHKYRTMDEYRTMLTRMSTFFTSVAVVNPT